MIGAYARSLLTIPVVLYRLKRLPPFEHQRPRRVLRGCLIGIPAFIFADSNEATSFWAQNIWLLATLHRWTPSRHEPDRIVIKLDHLRRCNFFIAGRRAAKGVSVTECPRDCCFHLH
jgi:hypothetical protein